MFSYSLQLLFCKIEMDISKQLKTRRQILKNIGGKVTHSVIVRDTSRSHIQCDKSPLR